MTYAKEQIETAITNGEFLPYVSSDSMSALGIIPTYYKGDMRKKYKEELSCYLEELVEVNDVNLRILLRKMADTLHNISTMDTVQLNLSEYCWAEIYIMGAYAAMELSNFPLSELGKATRGDEYTYSRSSRIFGNDDESYQKGLYRMLIGLYGILGVFVPVYRDDFITYTESSWNIYNAISYMRRAHTDRQCDAAKKKANEIYAKKCKKVAKARAEFIGTDIYAETIKLLGEFEDWMRKLDAGYSTYTERMNAREDAKIREAKLQSAEAEVKSLVTDAVSKEYLGTHGVCGIGELERIAATAYLDGGGMPTLEITESRTSSWLAGMKHYATFKVTGKDGKVYGNAKLQDRGLDGDGFGPWD